MLSSRKIKKIKLWDRLVQDLRKNTGAGAEYRRPVNEDDKDEESRTYALEEHFAHPSPFYHTCEHMDCDCDEVEGVQLYDSTLLLNKSFRVTASGNIVLTKKQRDDYFGKRRRVNPKSCLISDGKRSPCGCYPFDMIEVESTSLNGLEEDGYPFELFCEADLDNTDGNVSLPVKRVNLLNTTEDGNPTDSVVPWKWTAPDSAPCAPIANQYDVPINDITLKLSKIDIFVGSSKSNNPPESSKDIELSENEVAAEAENSLIAQNEPCSPSFESESTTLLSAADQPTSTKIKKKRNKGPKQSEASDEQTSEVQNNSVSSETASGLGTMAATNRQSLEAAENKQTAVPISRDPRIYLQRSVSNPPGGEVLLNDESKKKPDTENPSLAAIKTKVSGWFEDDNLPGTSGDEKPPRTEKQIMDEIIMYSFLKAMSTSFKHAKFPILAGTFYTLYVVTCCPPGKTISIKKSSFKRLSKLISEMQKLKLIEVCDLDGSQNIIRANFEHQMVLNFEDPFAERVSIEPSATFMENNVEPVVIQRYVISESVLGIFGEFFYQEGDMLSELQARRFIMKYLKKKKLYVQKDQSCTVTVAYGIRNKNELSAYLLVSYLQNLYPLKDNTLAFSESIVLLTIRLDSVLKLIVSDAASAPDTMTDKEIVSHIMVKLGRSFKIDAPNSEDAIDNKSVKIKRINLRIVNKRGNNVTVVENLQGHGIDLEQFVEDCRQGGATDADTYDSRKGRGLDVQMQGNKIHLLENLLTEKYEIPTRLLRGLHLATE